VHFQHRIDAVRYWKRLGLINTDDSPSNVLLTEVENCASHVGQCVYILELIDTEGFLNMDASSKVRVK